MKIYSYELSLLSTAKRDPNDIIAEHINTCGDGSDNPLCRKLEYVLHHLESKDRILSPATEAQFKASKTTTFTEDVDYPFVFENFIMKNR